MSEDHLSSLLFAALRLRFFYHLSYASFFVLIITGDHCCAVHFDLVSGRFFIFVRNLGPDFVFSCFSDYLHGSGVS